MAGLCEMILMLHLLFILVRFTTTSLVHFTSAGKKNKYVYSTQQERCEERLGLTHSFVVIAVAETAVQHISNPLLTKNNGKNAAHYCDTSVGRSKRSLWDAKR